MGLKLPFIPIPSTIKHWDEKQMKIGEEKSAPGNAISLAEVFFFLWKFYDEIKGSEEQTRSDCLN